MEAGARKKKTSGAPTFLETRFNQKFISKSKMLGLDSSLMINTARPTNLHGSSIDETHQQYSIMQKPKTSQGN